ELSGRTNPNSILNVFQMAEDPTAPGRYVAVDAPEFDTNGSGQLIAFQAPPSLNADQFAVEYLTPRSTFGTDPAAPGHSGHYRDPLVLADGRLVAARASHLGGVENLGSPTAPQPAYDFRLTLMADGPGEGLVPGPRLTEGLAWSVSWDRPDGLVPYGGPLWASSPVEVRAGPVPPVSTAPALVPPEAEAFADAGVDPGAFRQWLRLRGLAV